MVTNRRRGGQADGEVIVHFGVRLDGSFHALCRPSICCVDEMFYKHAGYYSLSSENKKKVTCLHCLEKLKKKKHGLDHLRREADNLQRALDRKKRQIKAILDK